MNHFNARCSAARGSSVPCFYSSLGLAVSTDNGKKLLSSSAKPHAADATEKSAYVGSGLNMAVGYGALIVADANGKHLDNPPADASGAYFLSAFFFLTSRSGSPGVLLAGHLSGRCARSCTPMSLLAVLSGDPHKVATVFHKYNGDWTQPGNERHTPDLSQGSGKFTPLWTDSGRSGKYG